MFGVLAGELTTFFATKPINFGDELPVLAVLAPQFLHVFAA